MEVCRGTASSRTKLWVKFSHRNPRDSIFILEDGNQPHPWYPHCDMFVPQESLNRMHPNSAICRRGTESKQQRLVVEETEEQMGRVLLAYGTPLTAIYLFWYLGQTLSSTDNNWPEVERNLRGAWGKWGRRVKILGR